MSFSDKNQYIGLFKAVSAGLLTAWAIGFVHVYLSNKHLYGNLLEIRKAGYLAVPNEQVWGALTSWGSAAWGGIFFSLSLGAGLSVAALLGFWIWDGLFRRWRPSLIMLILAWVVGIFAVNANGFSLLASAYPVLVVPVVFLVAWYCRSVGRSETDRLHRGFFLAVPVLLSIVWLPLAKGHVFLDIRDNVMFTSAIGKRINDFYYAHTLYAAEAFKSLEQKTIKTCSLELQTNESHRSAIEDVFLSYDYMVVDGDSQVDLSVKEQGAEVVFFYCNRKVISTTLRGFSADPGAVFSEFSNRTDRFKPLKLMAFGSMVIGSPVCLYIVLHGLFFFLLNLLIKPKKAGMAAVIICLGLGLAWALPLYMDKNQKVELGTLNQALESKLWQERVAALRYMSTKGLSNDQVAEEYKKWLASPQIAERYWYVRGLGVNQNPAAGKALLIALDDPSTNVVCMAYYSLGKRGDKSVIDAIIKRFAVAQKWYEQMYGYRALRALGWRQKKPDK